MLRDTLLTMARSSAVRSTVEGLPVSRAVVSKFVAGDGTPDAVRVAGELENQGLRSTIDHLGEDTADRNEADAVADAYVKLLDALGERALTPYAEVSVKLSAVGQALPGDGDKIALDNARRIAEAARATGTTMTLDMEDHTTTDRTLSVLRDLRADFSDVGAVLQAYLHRTEGDCRDLAREGSRVRLCKGAYNEPSSVAYQDKRDVDRSYVRCLKVLLGGQGYPMIATHDPRMVEIAGALATRNGREKGTYEYQMLYGVRPDEQLRLAGLGELVRVYLPYGADWYGYLTRRLAERPAYVGFFLRALTSKG